MLSICLHLLWESESARSLFISVPASPLSRRRERSAATSAPFQMAFSHCQMSLRPTPPTPPNHWSAPAPPLAAPAPRISLIPPETACPAATQIRCRSVSRTVQEKPSPDRNKSVPERRAVSSYSFETAPGKPCADSHSVQRCDECASLRSAAGHPAAELQSAHTPRILQPKPP